MFKMSGQMCTDGVREIADGATRGWTVRGFGQRRCQIDRTEKVRSVDIGTAAISERHIIRNVIPTG